MLSILKLLDLFSPYPHMRQLGGGGGLLSPRPPDITFSPELNAEYVNSMVKIARDFIYVFNKPVTLAKQGRQRSGRHEKAIRNCLSSHLTPKSSFPRC